MTTDLLTRGVENVFPSREALDALLAKKKITLFLGIDPTGPTLHIGHGVVLRKLRDFQRAGHHIILLIGDFTGMIGDPTDKSAARKRLTRDEVLANSAKYKEQASRFLSFDGKNAAEVKYNSTWLAPLTFAQVTEFAAHFTVQQMLARDMFDRRMNEGKPIHLHEFLYPLMQGYDSVAMDVDMEIGGNDQTFNMLAGRDLMKAMRGKEKFVMAMQLLEDPTGKKMGKTEGNMITFEDAPEDMYGKVMSWPDTMIAVGMELCTDIPLEAVKEVAAKMQRAVDVGSAFNPRDEKMRLARELVTLYCGAEAATQAEAHFVKTIQKGEVSDDMPTLAVGAVGTPIVEALVAAKFASSKSDARRLIDQRGVKVDGVLVSDSATIVRAPSIIKKGRFTVRLVSVSSV